MAYILTVNGKDQPGIVAAVSAFLAAHDLNIEDASQHNDKLSGRFFMRTVIKPSPLHVLDHEDFAKGFNGVASALSLHWDLYREDEKVPAILMVSKEDHCLHDILYRTRTGHLPLDIKAVVSNHDTCRELAESHRLSYYHWPVSRDNKIAQEEKLRALIGETGTELVVLARYMQILSSAFCDDFSGRIINIHHSFLPGFKGARPYHQAWERGVKIIGATAHFVTADLDEGPIIEQQTTRISHADTPESLQVIGRDTEAAVLSRALDYYCRRRVFLCGGRTVIL